MSNPRPCVCGHPQAWHTRGDGWCWLPRRSPALAPRYCWCHGYRPAPRKEPLRAWSRRKGLIIWNNGVQWPIEVRAAPSQPSHSTFTVWWNDDRHAYEVRDSDGPA